jgi:hypothetical protein
MMLGRLAVPVATYLDSGSPSQDYTQLASTFVNSEQGDIDVGAMYNNFPAHPLERHALGVHVIKTHAPGEYEPHEFWWFCTLHFGGHASPYLACQSQHLILELCKGDRHDTNNHWQWETVHFNLLGSEVYDPLMLRVMLLRKDGESATKEANYVDDIHPSIRGRDGSNEACCACVQLKSRMNSFGNQADDRKHRLPTVTSGSWNGVILHTDTPVPMISMTQKKWTRFKDGLSRILSKGKSTESLPTAELRKIAGSGGNILQVYQDVKCYLKGIFNALEAFRSNQDSQGWHVENLVDSAELLEFSVETGQDVLIKAQGDYPLTTAITSELLLRTEALKILFEGEQPLMLPICPTDIRKLCFFIGDASQEDFGGDTQLSDGTITS